MTVLFSHQSLPVGGRTDCCSICGRPLDEPTAAGLFGLNGVLCRGCQENITLYTPTLSAVLVDPALTVRLWGYTGTPGSPAWNSPSAFIILESRLSESNDLASLTRAYETLTSQGQALIWQLASHSLEGAYERRDANFSYNTLHGIERATSGGVGPDRENEEEHRRLKRLQALLDDPYAITPTELITTQDSLSGMEAEIDRLLMPSESTSASDDTDNSSAEPTLTEFT